MLPQSIFVTKVRTPAGKNAVRLLIDSIQAFGGEMSACPIWVFATDPRSETCRDLASSQVEVFPLSVPGAIQKYPFGDKVLACARAEMRAPAGILSLIWLDLNCLVIQPPVLFRLGDRVDAALRPVHVRNVGISPAEPLDEFWKGIYSALGVRDVDITVDSFVDSRHLRAYFNSHGFSVNPTEGLFSRWYELFDNLVSDQAFQRVACPDELHRIFLFQALFSALVASSINRQRIRILPPSYNYPYNLQARVPDDRRASRLNDLVTITYEDRTIHPEVVTDIEIQEPLRSWLQSRAAVNGE